MHCQIQMTGEVDLESRRKLAFRHRGRFRGTDICIFRKQLSWPDGNPGQIEDQGDERQLANLAKQREA